MDGWGGEPLVSQYESDVIIVYVTAGLLSSRDVCGYGSIVRTLSRILQLAYMTTLNCQHQQQNLN